MFPASPHSDTILAGLKDTIYIDKIGESLQEVARDIFGARRTEVAKPEVLLLARGLYYLLTIGTGGQSLGQEYCDISLVDSSAERDLVGPLLLPRRLVYVLLEVAFPYLWHRAVTGPTWWELHSLQRSRMGLPSERQQVQVSRVEHFEQRDDRDRMGYAERCRKDLRNIWVCIAQATRRIPSENRLSLLLWVSRLQLALFFINNRYYSWAMRFARVRLLRICELDRPRASYAFIGLLLSLQVAIEALIGAKHCIKKLKGNKDETNQIAENLRRQEALNSKVPPLKGSAAVGENATSSTNHEGNFSDHRCILCMNPSKNTAATLCGHLFCWDCILSWCLSNAQSGCPICRHPLDPQNIIPLQHY